MLPKTGGTEFRKPSATEGGDESSRKADANMAAFETTSKTDRQIGLRCNFRAVKRGKNGRKTATNLKKFWIPFWIPFLKNRPKSANCKNPKFSLILLQRVFC
jgi:hypothetical protein